MIDKVIKIGNLFDFYGGLLSTRQHIVVESFYIMDLSLAEIGEELKVSRQSIHDTLKRAEKKLFEFEKKLALVEKFEKNNDNILKILEISTSIENKIKNTSEDCKELKELINEIKDISSHILKDN